jgi:hypothetical protein
MTPNVSDEKFVSGFANSGWVKGVEKLRTDLLRVCREWSFIETGRA